MRCSDVMVEETHYPTIAERVRAAYFHRPASRVHGIADRIQIAMKALGPKGAEDVSLGISSARNVEKWTDD